MDRSKDSVSHFYQLIEKFYQMQDDCRRYKQLKELSINEFSKLKLFNQNIDDYLDKNR
jgi:hypothetical protein